MTQRSTLQGMSAPIDEATKRELAVQASCDPRTIEKVVRGQPVRGMAGRRARQALLAAGYAVPDAGSSAANISNAAEPDPLRYPRSR